jgi:hypothetical protein
LYQENSSPLSVQEVTWVDILAEFLKCLNEAKLLPIDHELINEVYQFWLETQDPLELDEIAEFLTFIPIQSYGFTHR